MRKSGSYTFSKRFLHSFLKNYKAHKWIIRHNLLFKPNSLYWLISVFNGLYSAFLFDSHHLHHISEKDTFGVLFIYARILSREENCRRRFVGADRIWNGMNNPRCVSPGFFFLKCCTITLDIIDTLCGFINKKLYKPILHKTLYRLHCL